MIKLNIANTIGPQQHMADAITDDDFEREPPAHCLPTTMSGSLIQADSRRI